MANRRGDRAGSEAWSAEARDRWRRRVLAGQGVYYILTGLWPLIHFSSFADAVAMQLNPFQSHAFAAVIVVVGGSLLEAARREPPGPFPTLLGAAVAAAISIVSLWWLPRLGEASVLWVDLVLEVALAVALILLYPRPLPQRARTSTRRR
ncbi:MAG: hypothetical protein V3U13_11195 [Gemmatimonadota bacterium]